MSMLICFIDKKGNSLPCIKEMSGIDAVNCKGCNYESQHNKYLDEINNQGDK